MILKIQLIKKFCGEQSNFVKYLLTLLIFTKKKKGTKQKNRTAVVQQTSGRGLGSDTEQVLMFPDGQYFHYRRRNSPVS